jgi:Ca2+/Na+ antiporter
LLFAGLLLVAGGLIVGLRAVMISYAASMSFDYSELLDSLYYPVLLSLLLAYVIWVRRMRWWNVVIPLFCIAGMLLSPLMYTYKYFYRIPRVNERYEDLMYPFSTFDDDLADLQPDDRLYISPRMDTEYGFLSEDPNDIVAMYNFYYDARITPANVFMGYTQEAMVRQLTLKDQSLAVLTWADWEYIQQDAAGLAAVEEQYKMLPDPQRRLVLLAHK